MRIYPAIDLKDGKCVRLVQGDYDKVTVFGDPVEMALKWEKEGASFLHLVDLDGAKAGMSINEEAIKGIIKAIKIPIQLGGGIRTLEDIERLLNLGITRVILGSIAVKNINIVKEAINKWGDEKIVVGVDAKDGFVAIHGWLDKTNLKAIDFCLELEKLGVKYVVYTDIARDGMLSGYNVLSTKEIVDKTSLKIIASGGASSIDDLREIEKINCEGVIIGKALYLEKIALKEAIEMFERV
ncbi:MAG: 1-(5-phosphoribosyl)-5-[(5-phosphoribosylamino)methylideneamino]imidazole-4-carboxamide isomerase [Bacilli bacterium]|jgi:phosphoribosylformimino-5-aminoimidazole carboxamide ribotide isomerase